MKSILMTCLFTSFLFSEMVDLLIKKDNKLNNKIATSINNKILNTNIIQQNSENAIIDLLVKKDSLRIGLLSEASLFYARSKDEKLNSKVKILFPLYENFIYLFVAQDSNISTLSDLKGKRVAMGTEGSSSWFVGKVLEKEKSLSWTNDNSSINSKEELIQVSFKLLTNQLDAFIYVGQGKNNLIEKHFQENTGQKLKLIEIVSDNFHTKEMQKEQHKWLDSNLKNILYTKEVVAVHNFFFIKGKTAIINKRYEHIIKKIKRDTPKQIKKEFNIDTRTKSKWKKWLDGIQISYKELYTK